MPFKTRFDPVLDLTKRGLKTIIIILSTTNLIMMMMMMQWNRIQMTLYIRSSRKAHYDSFATWTHNDNDEEADKNVLDQEEAPPCLHFAP